MNRSIRNALIIGLIAAIVVAIVVYAKYTYFNASLPEFSLMGIASKVILLVFVFIAGYLSIRYNEGIAAIKPMFRSMFLVILLGELSIGIMDYVCMFTIFPDFIDTFHASNVHWMETASQWPQERKEQALGDILSMKKTTVQDALQGLMQSIIISSIFAIIFAFIITTLNRKNKQLAALQQRATMPQDVKQ